MKRYRKKYLNNRRKQKHMIVVMAEYFMMIILVCIVYLCYTAIESNRNKSLYNNSGGIISKPNFSTEPEVNELRQKFLAANAENPEVVGWITIDDTNISYPLLQTIDNTYYLTHNYKKENSSYGSIFLHKNCALNYEFSNLLIYGHNLNGGDQMFSELMNYKDEEFYQNHKTIRITTADKEFIYTVFAVFKSKIYNNDETGVFKYYTYTDLSEETKFYDFIAQCKKYQLYNTNTSAVYGNQIISLITCEYSQENGRLVVVGKKSKILTKTQNEQ